MKLAHEIAVRAGLDCPSKEEHFRRGQKLAEIAVRNLNKYAGKAEPKKQLSAGGPPAGGGPGSGNYDHKKSGGGDATDKGSKAKGPKLSDEDLENKFRGELHKDWDGAKEKYKANFGRVLNADNAKELSPDYLKDRSRAMAVHEPASELTKSLYDEELKKPAPAGLENSVVFTAGAPGAGKSTALESEPGLNDLSHHAQIVYDGTFADPDSASRKINQALGAGKGVHVVYVHRDPAEAFENGVLPRATRQEKKFGSGRVVPIVEAADQHAKIQASMDTLRDRFKDNPLVSFHAIDNSRGLGNAKAVDFADIPKVTDSKEQLASKMNDIADKAYLKQKISKNIYNAAKGPSLGKHT